ncbi:MAG: DnaJ domain-containing protein [Candidatus Muiribacteriota bacterium]
MNYLKALKILGLDNDCTLEEAKKTFRKIALKNHPDINKEFDSDKWNNILEAYNYLCKHFNGSFNFRELEKYFEEIKKKLIPDILIKIRKKIFKFDKIKIERKIYCNHSDLKNKKKCLKCNGLGVIVYKTGIFTREKKCSYCCGAGFTTSCILCKGKVFNIIKTELDWSDFVQLDENLFIAKNMGNEYGIIKSDVYISFIQ